MAEFDQNTYQPQEGDLYIQEVRAGRFTIHRYDGEIWEQLGAGHSEQDIKTLIAPMAFLGESRGKRQYYRPTGSMSEVRQESEAAYRRGWQHGATETTLIILQLVELGYNRRKINQLLAIYQDHFISEWRNTGDLEKREAFPPFDIQRIEEIAATHRGYDWLLESEA